MSNTARQYSRGGNTNRQDPQLYSTVQDEGVALPQQIALNFVGGGVTAADDAANNRTNVTIPLGAGLNPPANPGENNMIAWGLNGNLSYGPQILTDGTYVGVGAVGAIATAGSVRLANAGSVQARNAAGTADANLINLTAGNAITIGDSAVPAAVNVQAFNNAAGNGGFIQLIAGTGSVTGGVVNILSGGGAAGGNINLTAGAGTAGAGGLVAIAGGAGPTSGGLVALTPGAGSAGPGGALFMTTGGGSTNAGDATLTTGNGAAGTGGNITWTTGTGTTFGGNYAVNTGAGVGAGTSGAMNFTTGAAPGAGNSGGVSYTIGASVNGSTGSFSISIGTSTNGAGGNFSVTCGQGGTTGGSANINGGPGVTGTNSASFTTGNATGAGATAGTIAITAGNANTGASTGGSINVNCGTATGVGGQGGSLSLNAANGATGGAWNATAGTSSAAAGATATLNAGGGTTAGGNWSAAAGAASAGNGGSVTLNAGTGTGGIGGNWTAGAGAGTGGNGGQASLSGGVSTTAVGGAVSLIGGGGSTNGGDISLQAGAGTAGPGGDVVLNAAQGSTNGGGVTITAGNSTGAGNGGTVDINAGTGGGANGTITFDVGATRVFEIGATFGSVGASPAASGELRLQNTGAINWRNAAGAADVSGLTVNGSDQVILGGTNAADVRIAADGNTIAIFDTTFMSLGTTPATAGLIRIPNSEYIYARNAANTANREVLILTNTDELILNGGANIDLRLGLSGNANISIGNAAAASFQSMQRGIYIRNAGAVPTGNPGAGGFMYATGGAGTWRGSGGTVTTFGPADPHCSRCHRDWVSHAWNPGAGDKNKCDRDDDPDEWEGAICWHCFIDEARRAGMDPKKFLVRHKRYGRDELAA